MRRLFSGSVQSDWADVAWKMGRMDCTDWMWNGGSVDSQFHFLHYSHPVLFTGTLNPDHLCSLLVCCSPTYLQSLPAFCNQGLRRHQASRLFCLTHSSYTHHVRIPWYGIDSPLRCQRWLGTNLGNLVFTVPVCLSFCSHQSLFSGNVCLGRQISVSWLIE